jgi:hypothetical protein
MDKTIKMQLKQAAKACDRASPAVENEIEWRTLSAVTEANRKTRSGRARSLDMELPNPSKTNELLGP